MRGRHIMTGMRSKLRDYLQRFVLPAARAARRRRQRGITLVELLVVIAIIALIATLAVSQLTNLLGGTKSDTAKLQIGRLAGIIDIYYVDVGGYPPNEMGLLALVEQPSDIARWNGPYLKNRSALLDPWGRPYQYRLPGQHGVFDLFSLGADGQEGGEGEDKDLTNW